MANKQVSVMIRAALDSAFRTTFHTADKRIKDLTGSIREMKSDAANMRGLIRTREEISALSGTIAKQKVDLGNLTAAKVAAANAASVMDNAVARAAETAKAAKEEHRRLREELEKTRAEIEAANKPTKEQIELLGRMKAEVRAARQIEASARREAENAAKTLNLKKQKLEELTVKIREQGNALSAAKAAEEQAKATYRELRAEYDQARAAIERLAAPTKEQLIHLAQMKDRVEAARRAQTEATHSVDRFSRSLEVDQQRAREATSELTLFEARANSTGDAAAAAAAEVARLSRALDIQQKSISAGPTELEASTLKMLENRAEKSRVAAEEAQKAQEKVNAEREAHNKQAIANGESVSQLTKKESELTSELQSNAKQLERLGERSKEYSKTLEKNGHDVENLENAEKELTQTIARRQRTLQNSRSAEAYADRARDLRNQAQTSLWFTLGSGYFFTSPIKDAIEFEKAMKRVKAMSAATGEEYKKLKAEARRLGAETVYSALEVAKAQNELATAGLRTDEIISVMPSMLDLANSSMTDLARTAEITSEVLQGFNIDVSDMKRVGDALTAAYTSSASSLDSLGEMLKYVSSVAVDVNSSLEQTLAASSVLHNNGIKGSMAGTGLRAVFLRLSDPPAKLKKMLKDMDVSIKDSAGNMRNWVDIFHDINRALEGSGSATKAAAWKKLGGEDHATTASKLAAAEKSGALQLEINKYKMAPAFNAIGKNLLAIPEADLQEAARSLGFKFNRAMSSGGVALNLAGSLKGLKGKEYEAQLEKIFRSLKIAPSLGDIKASEFQWVEKKTEAALKRLHINPLKAMGGQKSHDELTREIKTQLQTLPAQEQLQYVELFFSKTRSGMAELLKTLAPGGKAATELATALGETLNMEKTRKELSDSAANDLEQLQGDWNDIKVSLGESLIPMLRDFAATLKPITERFAKWIAANQGFAKGIMLAIGGIFAFSAAMAVLKFALSGVVSLVAGGKSIREFFGKDTWARKGAGRLWDATKWSGRKGKGALKWGGHTALRAMKKAGGGGFRALKWGGGLIEAGFSRLISAGPRLISMFGLVMNVVRAVGAAMLATPIGLVVTALVVGAILIWRNWSTVGPWLTKMWAKIGTFFASLWTGIVAGMKTAWDWIKENMSWHPVVYIAKNWEKLVDFFKGIYEKIKPYIKMLFPMDTSEIKLNGPDEPGFFSKLAASSKGTLSSLFSVSPDLKVDVPSMPSVARASDQSSYTQRNVITVHANITVESGPSAPIQVAHKIKSEIQTAFKNTPSFDLFDSAVVS